MNSQLAAFRGGFAAAALLIAGCQTMPASEPNAFADADNNRLIVVTVANEVAPAIHPGSTPRGYESFPYEASTEARKTAAALANDYHLRMVKSWPIAALHVHCIVFEIPEDGSRADLLRELADDKRVRLAQPMQAFGTLSKSYNDPYVSLQSGFRELGVAAAHEWSHGERVRVAVIDSGIDFSHPDLRDRVVLKRNFVDRDMAQFERDRHGTEVAGVIAAVANNRQGIVGVAPRVELLAFKSCWQLAPGRDDARCNSFTLAQGLVAAMDANAQVVNLSLAGPADPLLGALVALGLHRGIVFVGATASSSGIENSFPASLRGVLAVQAMEHDGTSPHALLAPGREILTLLPGGRYDFASGTSLATAHVTGTVALLLARDGSLNADRIYGLLERTSTRVGVAQSISACGALASVTGNTSCEAPASVGATSLSSAARPTPVAPRQR